MPISTSLEEKLCHELNDEQRAAVMAPSNTTLQVMAGAGTGKTKLLARRFVKLTLDRLSQNPDEEPTQHFWVSTFTEKAAREMRERIQLYLEDTAGMTLHPQAWIGTFHSLCQRVLKRHANEKPHLKNFTLLASVELEIFQEAFVQTLIDSPDYRHFIDYPLGDLEDAFSTIVTKLIPRIKAAGLSPEGFYQQALQQTQNYTLALQGLTSFSPEKDFHEVYARHWQQDLSGFSQDGFSFFPSEWQIEIEAQKALEKRKTPPSDNALLKENLKFLFDSKYYVTYDGRKKIFSAPIKSVGELTSTLTMEKSLIQDISRIYQDYQKALRAENALDYEDLIHETLTLLNDNPHHRESYQNHFSHLMVDEFQDSNGSQLRLIELLCSPQNPGLTVVGDKKQSIYGFRYAQPENLDILFRQLPQKKTLHLHHNYRSSGPILKIANRITQMMGEPTEAQLTANSKETPVPTQWLKVSAEHSADEARQVEADWIVQTICEKLATDSYQPKDMVILVYNHNKAGLIEKALTEYHIPSIRQRQTGFFQNPILQQAVCLLKLVENPENDKSLIGILQHKLSHHQLFALACYRDTLKQTLGLTQLSYFDTLSNLLNGHVESTLDLEQYRPLLSYLVSTVSQLHQKHNTTRPDILFAQILQAFPLLTPQQLQTAEGKTNLKQLELLRRLLLYWVESSAKPLTLNDILLRVERCAQQPHLELPVEDDDFAQNAIRIISMHGAKGLEFPVVFLANVDTHQNSRFDAPLTFDPQHDGKSGFGFFLNQQQNKPNLKKEVYNAIWLHPRNMAERLRLFYVGVTRAERELYISSWPKSFPYIRPTFFEHDCDIQFFEETDLHETPPTQAEQWKSLFSHRYKM